MYGARNISYELKPVTNAVYKKEYLVIRTPKKKQKSYKKSKMDKQMESSCIQVSAPYEQMLYEMGYTTECWEYIEENSVISSSDCHQVVDCFSTMDISSSR